VGPPGQPHSNVLPVGPAYRLTQEKKKGKGLRVFGPDVFQAAQHGFAWEPNSARLTKRASSACGFIGRLGNERAGTYLAQDGGPIQVCGLMGRRRPMAHTAPLSLSSLSLSLVSGAGYRRAPAPDRQA